MRIILLLSCATVNMNWISISLVYVMIPSRILGYLVI